VVVGHEREGGSGKRRKDGSRVGYAQLAHNVWDKDRGRSQVQVIHTFGRTDQLDEDGMRRGCWTRCGPA